MGSGDVYKRQSVANGLMEAVLERRMETIRSTDEQSKTFIQKQEIRALRTINWLEKIGLITKTINYQWIR